MAGQGLLLPDLAFRLSAVRFAIPPLRMRREDIAPLAQALLEKICARYQQRPVTLGPGALARLLQHAWPGNVRELASVLETALLEAVNGVIRPDDLNLPNGLESPTAEHTSASPAANLSLDAVIRHHVQYVLDLNRGNKLRAARQLHQPLHPLPHPRQRDHPLSLTRPTGLSWLLANARHRILTNPRRISRNPRSRP
jgi:DNA-binding NtrC family response regulator